MNNKYIYRKNNFLTNSAMLILSIVFIVIGIFYLSSLVALLINPLLKGNLSAIELFLYFIGFSVWSPIFFIFATYLASEINLTDDGLQINFIFKNILVKWDDIVEIKPAKPFGLRIGRKASILIVKSGLISFHRIYGSLYGQTNQPALLIWSNISEYESLMKQISKNRRKK